MFSYYLRPGSQLSYYRVKEVVLAKFKVIGLDALSFGLHSLRIGGAFAEINNNMPDRVVKKHDRWKTESVKDLHSREDINDQLMVSLHYR